MALSNAHKTHLNKMNSTAHKVSLGDVIAATETVADAALVAADVVVYTSSAGAGGGATEAMTLTGLAAGDTILSVCQKTNGANDLPLLGYSTQATNALTGIWSADPGAGAVIVVSVVKA